MQTVEIKSPGGLPVAMAFLYPFPLAAFPSTRGLVELRRSAEAFGFPYVFVFALDRVRGWATGGAAPFFDEPTEKILGFYGTDGEALKTAWVSTLTSLAEAWLTDVQGRWKSRAALAPGEAELGPEFVARLRGEGPNLSAP